MNPVHPPYDLPEEIVDLLGDNSPESISELAAVWQMAGTCALNVETSTESKTRLRSKVMASVHSSSRSPVRLRPKKSDRPSLRLVFSRMTAMSAVAACLALIVVASFVFSPEITTVRVPAGTLVSQVALPDGSNVSLAAGSRLSFPSSFDSDARRVKSYGAAFFDVEPAAIPFEVETFDSVVRVLGTSFSVEAWPSNLEADSRVVVASGKVQVMSGESLSVLTPGQAIRSSVNKVEESVDVKLATSWRTGGLAYSNELLGNVLSDLERRFSIQLDAPASIRLRRISIQKQQASDAAEIIGDISATVGIRYRPIQGGYELYLQ